ncbi:MAG: hypothetical protein ACAH83_15145 [Alphaproteobacteria bacterium]
MSGENNGEGAVGGEPDIVVDHAYLSRLQERRGRQADLQGEIADADREIAQIYALRAARFGAGWMVLGVAGIAAIVLAILAAATNLPFIISLPVSIAVGVPPMLAARWCWRSRTFHVPMTMLLGENLPKEHEAEISRLMFLEGHRSDLLYHLPGGKERIRTGRSGMVLMLVIFGPVLLLCLIAVIVALASP